MILCTGCPAEVSPADVYFDADGRPWHPECAERDLPAEEAL